MAALEILDKKLTCHECNRLFIDPRKLCNCEDTFCLVCIERLAKTTKGDRVFVCCPICQVESVLPKGSVDQLPIDQVVVQLFDVRKELAHDSVSVSDTQGILNEEACPDHGEALKGYCETCHKVICRDCTMSLKHNGHTYCLISECYSKHCSELEIKLKSVRKKMVDMDEVVSGLGKTELEVMKQGESIKDDIESHAQQIMELVQVSKQNLFKEVDEIVSRKKKTLSKQNMEASKILKTLKACEAKVSKNMSELTQAKVLMNKEEMIEEMKDTCDVDHSVFKPIETTDMKFARNLSFLSDQDIGEFVGTSFSEAVLDQQNENQDSNNTTSMVTASLKFKAHDGGIYPLPSDIVVCKLLSASRSENCCVSKTGIGEYKIAMPSPASISDKKHKLVVQAGGIEVPGSPFKLETSSLTIKERTPVKSMSGLSQPKGIAICNGGIVVVETSAHCVTILNSEGHCVHTYGERNIKKTFIYPRGVAIHKDKAMYVTDDHRLHKIDIIKRSVMKTIGKPTPGNGQMQLRNPHDIVIHPSTGNVFVADSGNNRIQVFKNDLSFLFTIDNYRFNRSKSSSCFNEPIGLTFDSDNNLYVSEYLNHCITKVTAKGQFIMKIGSEGSDPGNLYGPASITTHNNHIYVAEMGIDRVSVFDSQGVFHSGFWHRGQDMDSNTHGIAVDAQGKVYISDNMTSITIY